MNKLFDNMPSFFKEYDGIKNTYLMLAYIASLILTYLTDLHTAILAFLLITIIDTITSIDASAKQKGLKFNPFKKYFWKEIKSEGLRQMCDKIFRQYFMYLMIAFIVDVLILKKMVIVELWGDKLTLPMIALYIFSAIEIWSVGENIEKRGGVNLPKRVFHLLPEKIQKILKQEE